MNQNLLTTFTAKISAEDFLKVMSKIYGRRHFKDEWIQGIMTDIDGKWDSQLTDVLRVTISETGVKY